jgi:ubiquinone/menaquinone biosynthesis C-methylase UbiE
VSRPIPFDPSRFKTTAAYYAAHRPPYPAQLIDLVADALVLAPPARLLDLGCGPAMLAIAFAPRCGSVVAMDPEPEMLTAAASAAAESRVDIHLIEGSSFDLIPEMGPFRTVTMGRSFHWMDRPATLSMLDRLIEPGGAVVIFGETTIGHRAKAWRSVMQDSIERFSERGSARAFRNAPDWLTHEEVLAASAFSAMTRYGVVSRRQLSIDQIIGRALSSSAGSPQALGDRVESFAADLRQRLEALEPNGQFVEFAELSGLVARRPNER